MNARQKIEVKPAQRFWRLGHRDFPVSGTDEGFPLQGDRVAPFLFNLNGLR
jgi:hypothetical protein